MHTSTISVAFLFRSALFLLIILPLSLQTTFGADETNKEKELTPYQIELNKKMEVSCISGKNESPVIWNINNTKYTVINENTKWFDTLYKKKDYKTLTEHILKLLKREDEKVTSDLTILYNYLAETQSDEKADMMGDILIEWCKKEPLSHIPWLIRGVFQIREAWRVRGYSYARDVDATAWAVFKTKLKLAKKLLEKSQELNPDDPNSSAKLLVLCYGLSLPAQTMEKHFSTGIKACPWHAGLYFAKLQYLSPKWGGDAKRKERFITKSSAVCNKYLSLNYINYEAVARKIEPDARNIKTVYKHEKVWPLILKHYTRYFEKYPDDLRERSHFACDALWASQNEIACEQFALMGNRWVNGSGAYGRLKDYHEYRAHALSRFANDKLNSRKHKRVKIRGYKTVKDVISLCEQSIELQPTAFAYSVRGSAQWTVGIFLMSTSFLRKAHQSFKEAVKIDPDYKWGRDNLKSIERQCRNHLKL